MLGGLDKVIGNRRGWGNCVLTADCVRGIGQSVREGKGVGELCVDGRLC